MQNKSNQYWNIDTVLKKLDETIIKIFNNVYKLSIERNISLRIACYSIALNRLLQVYKSGGIV